MNIKLQIYDNLTPKQRIIASIDAMARGDEEERLRLIKSCPKKSYRLTDSAYSFRIETLQQMAMAVECDMRGLSLDYLGQLLSHEKSEKELLPNTSTIQEMLNIREAWHDLLEGQGIEPSAMGKAHDYLGHYSVEYFIDRDGTATNYSWQNTARIEGQSGEWTDANDMMTQGDLVVL